jgi:hypothetical protein
MTNELPKEKMVKSCPELVEWHLVFRNKILKAGIEPIVEGRV